MESWGRIGGTGVPSWKRSPQSNTHVSALTSFQSSVFDISQVNIENGGAHGDGTLIVGLHNRAEGWYGLAAHAATEHTNHNYGEINNFNGQIRFDGAMHNHGFIAGRGEFVANGIWRITELWPQLRQRRCS